MHRLKKFVLASGVLLVLMVLGCQGESARIDFSYTVQPVRGLPPGLKTIYVEPAKTLENTDTKWSDMTATVLRTLIQESHDQLGAPVTLADREDTKGVTDEADLRAAGMLTGEGSSQAQFMGADGRVLANIKVKVEQKERKDSTLDITSIAGAGGHGWGGGDVDMQTREVSGWTRTITVVPEFKLLDNNNKLVHQDAPALAPITHDTGKASPLYGSNRGLGDLPAEDQIIAALIDQGARQFVSYLMPCRISVAAMVESSGSKACTTGVKMLRAGMYQEALSNFQAAMAGNQDDHQAAFGAGLACEAMGDGQQALSYYRRALVGAQNEQYMAGRARMEAYGNRIRRG